MTFIELHITLCTRQATVGQGYASMFNDKNAVISLER